MNRQESDRMTYTLPDNMQLTQTADETIEEWRLRIIDLFEAEFKAFQLSIRASPSLRNVSEYGPGHNFCIIFEHSCGFSVMVTPHSTRGVDVSIAKGKLAYMTGRYDITDMRKVVSFLKSMMEPDITHLYKEEVKCLRKQMTHKR